MDPLPPFGCVCVGQLGSCVCVVVCVLCVVLLCCCVLCRSVLCALCCQLWAVCVGPGDSYRE